VKHPSRNYINYLISKRSLGARDIWNQLVKLGLPAPVEASDLSLSAVSIYIEKLRQLQSSTLFPPGYNPTDPKHAPTIDFLKQKKIYDVWAKDPFVWRAFDLLDMPAVKRTVEIMLLGPLSYSAIARRVAKRYGLDLHIMNTRVVQCYAHYFWDFNALDKAEWMELLQKWIPGYTADYQASLQSPRTPSGAALSVWMADGSLEPLRDVTMMRVGRDQCFKHFLWTATTKHPSQSTAETMRACFEVICKAQEQIDMRQGGSAEVLDELRRIETVYDNNPLTTALELPVERVSIIDVESEPVEKK